MPFKTLNLALSAAALSLASIAFAAGGSEQQVKVNYADLDLTSVEGLAELDRRIDEAARQLCGVAQARTGTRLPSRSARKCYDEAKNQLDTPFAMIKREANLGG